MRRTKLDPNNLINFLGRVLRDEGNTEELQLLRTCTPYVEEDSNPFGLDDWRLILQTNTDEFVRHRLNIASICQRWKALLEPLVATQEDFRLNEVKLVCESIVDTSWKGGLEQPLQTSAAAEDKLWQAGCFRLFISHKSEAKNQLSTVCGFLKYYGIDGFLAHTTIEPDEFWRSQIRLGLQTCDSLVAVLTAGFGLSAYCQQELGWAMGRGIYWTSIKIHEDPSGLSEELQATTMDLSDSEKMARVIALRIRKQERLVDTLYRGIIQRFSTANSGADAWYVYKAFKNLGECPPEYVQPWYETLLSNPITVTSKGIAHYFPEWCNQHGLKTLVFPTPGMFTLDGEDEFPEDFWPFEDE